MIYTIKVVGVLLVAFIGVLLVLPLAVLKVGVVAVNRLVDLPIDGMRQALDWALGVCNGNHE